ncbi:uncharacterized protein LDX57_007080 [Aspergillus melleus]|uniref:uncharacterized protein n=1 Tax=Aspergillus melleus TaxID=138277 RepID=UPI001E8DCA1C|nr:uncharacterized protein LDX57_007080 [Aspergillus melleus]KAH8429417.1 hypothetical protein LDX57_007080 [Aspergillus melleus]
MAPWRRSTAFSESLLFSPDSYNHNSWVADIHLLRSDLGPLPYTTVWLVSEFLILVALLVFFPGACTIKQSSCGATALFPSLAVIGSLVSYILSQILSVILLLVYFLEATVKQSYVIAGILQMIFRLLALLLLYYALYQVILEALERVSFPAGLFTLVKRGHLGVLGVLSIVITANFALRIVSVGRAVEGTDAGIVAHDNRLTTSRVILFMIISLEVLLWVVFYIFTSSSSSELLDSQARSISLVTSALSYLILTLTSAIGTIRYVYLHVPEPGYVNAACALVEFFSIVGIYTGLTIYWIQIERDEEAISIRNRLRSRHSSERKPYITYRPSIGEVLSGPGYSNKVGGTDGTWKGSSEEAYMSGGI